ncbi:MAG: class I SAM-dependent DNA methyltransferase [Bacteroidaceae bacterium]|nr:class I SAM-dependent DNA methyltransferase [Bacteroidaceae bacterium]
MAKKLQLGYREIEQRLADSFSKDANPAEVGYRLLYSFGKSERDIERFKEGKGILKTFDGLLIKGLFCYKPVKTVQLTQQIERLKSDQQVVKAAPKIVAVSDGKTLLAYDLREKDTYENQLERLPSDFAFFYPLMDVERVHYVEESPADIKAAEKLAKLHDELRAYNEFRTGDDLHDLNIFITRLLFCFFAEDTGIFEENLFTDSIRRFTKEDGSDLSDYMNDTFNVMDLSVRRMDIPSIVKQFPYVNGGLFSKHIQIPQMGAKARRLIIECGELDWKDINPDIFGSMIQAVVNPEERASQGMHYTSVPNIMKVINPLFLDDLRKNYHELSELYEQKRQMLEIGAINQKQFADECKSILRKSETLLGRMSRMKFFDPACGSGNFLIITYKCLRFLEMDILALQRKCTQGGNLLIVDNSVISLNQFYGIELLDFPHEVAMLSLWLAEHQMNTKLNAQFGVNTRALPLKNITQIVCGNACRLDWNRVCPHTAEEEVFVFGNPPYLGYSKQSREQKQDLLIVCGNIPNYSKMDYISCWFVKGAQYIYNNRGKFAFVTTNSVTQGEQVALLWKHVLKRLVIDFAYRSFMWKNNAKYNAMVAVTIIGLSNINTNTKRYYDGNKVNYVENINPYLIIGKTTFVEPTNTSISGFPEMIKGCSPVDDQNLLMTLQEKDAFENVEPLFAHYIKSYIGADEFVNGKERFCFYFDESDKTVISRLSEQSSTFRKRLEKVRIFRESSTKEATRNYADTPYLFIERKYRAEKSIVVPQTGSEKRKYLPMGVADENTVLSNAVRLIYCGSEYDMCLFGILASFIHMVWVRTVAGRMKTDMQYSNTICYNTFPFPTISSSKKSEIASAAENVLVTREFYPDKTLAELYDPDKMPQDLREAHAKLDDIVESCYPGYPFTSDEARLECLFKLYEKMTSKD